MQNVTRRTMIKGSAVTLIGAGLALPALADSSPAREELLKGYSTWLYYERRLLMKELLPGLNPWEAAVLCLEDTIADDFHFPTDRNWKNQPPSSRAELVLKTVGCQLNRLEA